MYISMWTTRPADHEIVMRVLNPPERPKELNLRSLVHDTVRTVSRMCPARAPCACTPPPAFRVEG